MDRFKTPKNRIRKLRTLSLGEKLYEFKDSKPFSSVCLVTIIIVASYTAYFSAGLGVKFFPDIEPEQAVVQVLTRGDLSAKEKDTLVKNTEKSILGVDGVLINYAKSGPDGRTKDLIGAVRTIFTDWDEREKAAGLMDQMRSKVKL